MKTVTTAVYYQTTDGTPICKTCGYQGAWCPKEKTTAMYPVSCEYYFPQRAAKSSEKEHRA